MKLSLSLVVSFIMLAQITFAQNSFEIFGGPHTQHLWGSVAGNQSADLKHGMGYHVGLSYNNYTTGGILSKFSLMYSKQSASSITENLNSADFPRSSDLEWEKESLHLTVYPFTFFVQKLFINFGLEGSLVQNSSVTGMYKHGNITGMLQEEIVGENGKIVEPTELNYGLVARFAYPIPVGQSLNITPQFISYLGLNKEYVTPDGLEFRSFRNQLSLSLEFLF